MQKELGSIFFQSILQCLHKILYSENIRTQPAITCLKLTVETLEQDVKYVQS